MDPRDLVERLAPKEEELPDTPCVAGGRIRAKIEGLVHDFVPRPADFEGWGVFQAIDAHTARRVETASARHVDGYLRLLRPLRLYLVRPLVRGSWAGLSGQRGRRPPAPRRG